MNEYAALKKRLATGWNTWNTRSVLSHVLLPQGFAINLGIKNYNNGGYLKEALVGGPDAEVRPGQRTYDGRYTELQIKADKIELTIQSATDGDDLVLLITPHSKHRRTPVLAVEAGLLWNRPGHVRRDGEVLIGATPVGETRIYATAPGVVEPYIWAQMPYLALLLDRPLGVSTGSERSLEQIQSLIAQRKSERDAATAKFGELAETYAAAQNCLAWDTIYDPLHDRVISPVSRAWNCNSGGYVLFEWDTYFASMMAGIENRDLAYANAIEITREKTKDGFIPNFAHPSGFRSADRSQPPVGSLAIWTLFQKFGDRWLLEEVFETLLEWNRWWWKSRQVQPGLLAWGSNPYEPVVDNFWEIHHVNDTAGATLESGLDNSPMYDGIPFDAERHILLLADVGLTSLYVMDCRVLGQIAQTLGRVEAAELRQRGDTCATAMQSLWSEEDGLFLNRRTDTGEFMHRLSPNHFYPLLGKVATAAQAQRMITEHFYNPQEFWGDWILPSIARNDPAYPDQTYWRGRIWAPMNFLVYLGLCQYDLPQARRDLAEKSRKLLLQEWREHGHVHENYCGDTGRGCGVKNSDPFYHWGGLLGLISVLEANHFSGAILNQS